MSRPRTTPLARDDSPAALMAAGVPAQGDEPDRSRVGARHRRQRRPTPPRIARSRVKHRAAPPTGRQVEPQCLPDETTLPALTMPALPVLDLRRARTSPVATSRDGKAPSGVAVIERIEPGLTVAELIARLPDAGAAADLRAAAEAIATARHAGNGVVLCAGIDTIAPGLAPLIVDLMERRVITAVALDGAALLHDFALAVADRESSSVGGRRARRPSTTVRDPGTLLHRIVHEAAARGEGLGEAVGRHLATDDRAHRARSISAAGARLGLPITMHVAIGADDLATHPGADGAALGATSLRDFHRLTSVVAGLARGVCLNVGCSATTTAAFRTALALARELGHTARPLVTVDVGVARSERFATGVRPPVATGARGLHLAGDPELLLPLLSAAVLDRLAGTSAAKRTRPRGAGRDGPLHGR